MRKAFKAMTVAAVAAGIGALALAGTAQATGYDAYGPKSGNSGAHSSGINLVNVDASSAAHWQICGQNVATLSEGQECDNKDHVGMGPQSGASADGVSAGNLDISDAAHWQICGQNAGVQSLGQSCDNSDHHS